MLTVSGIRRDVVQTWRLDGFGEDAASELSPARSRQHSSTFIHIPIPSLHLLRRSIK